MRWSGGPNAGPNVAWARQSLPPIIWNGRLSPALNDSSQWGFTVGNAVRVWRTGVGIDRRGNLIFAAADDQTVITLGANPAACRGRCARWSSTSMRTGTPWSPTPTTTASSRRRSGRSNQPSTRYLSPDDRDFFAVYRRLPGPVTVPFK